MVLLASDYDKSKYLRAEDLKQETKVPHQSRHRRGVREQRQDGEEARRAGSPTTNGGWC